MNPPNEHRFPKYCLDAEGLTKRPFLQVYVEELHRQAKSSEAVAVYGKVRGTNMATFYEGEGGEFLRHCYFEAFGHEEPYNLKDIWSLNMSEGLVPDDLGWDGTAVDAATGSPVYIQDKTTVKHETLLTMDSGLMTFAGSAALHARKNGVAETARFLVWTTAAGLDWTLMDRMHEQVEVVAFKEISQRVDGNNEFWRLVADKLMRKSGD